MYFSNYLVYTENISNISAKVFVLNGPNLNLLGAREPNIYGSSSLGQIELKMKQVKNSMQKGLEFEFKQTNSEVEAIELIQQLFENQEKVAGLLINPGAWTHYSYALRDALSLLKQANINVIEVHISQPAAREEFRKTSVISEVVSSTVSGMGIMGYILSYQYLCEQYNNEGYNES